MKPRRSDEKVSRFAARLVAAALLLQNFAFSVSTSQAATENAYRWRNDDGSESSATYAASENAALSSVPKDVTERLRFGVSNNGSEGELLRKAGVTLNAGENEVYSAAVDSANGYAYFGTNTSPGRVIKVRLSDFTEVGSLTLNSGENILQTAAIDSANGYAYFGTVTSPGRVVKVALGSGNAAPTRVGAVTLNSGENALYSVVIDAPNGYAYFGTATTLGVVIKVALGSGASAPTRVGAVTLNSGEDQLRSAAIDTANGYAYFGTYTTPSRVVKVALGAGAAAPTRVGAVTLNSGEEQTLGAVIDAANGYAYFDTLTSPGKVVKVALGSGASAPTRVGAVTLNSGEDYPVSAVIDPANGYAYFGTYTGPGKVVKVALGARASAPTRVGAVTVNSGEDALYSAAIDTANGYAYFGTITSPGKVVKVSIAPHASFRLEYGLKTSTCSAISSWTQVGSGATPAWAMSDSANVTDGAATTNSAGVTDGNSSFKAGAVKDAASETASISLGEKQFTEMEYAVKATADAAAGGDYCFRLTDAGVPTAFTYSNYAEATVEVINLPAPTLSSISPLGTRVGGSGFTLHAYGSDFSDSSVVRWNGADLVTTFVSSSHLTASVTDDYLETAGLASVTVFTPTPGGGETGAATFDVAPILGTVANTVAMSRTSAGAESGQLMAFSLLHPLSGTLTVTYPAGFTVLSDPAADASSPCLSGFGHTAQTVYATKTDCSGTIFLGGYAVQNPSLAGLYTITWVNDDPGYTVVAILDDDQVTVNALVDPTITFDINTNGDNTPEGPDAGTYAVPLGALEPGTPKSSDNASVDSIWLNLATNAGGGAIVTVLSANGADGLKSLSSGDTIPNDAGTMSGAAANYGLCVASATQGTGTLQASAPYSSGTCVPGGTANDVKALNDTIPTMVIDSNDAPLTSGVAELLVNANASSTTPAHDDYADTLTFAATGTF